jgi:hypothetical protein
VGIALTKKSFLTRETFKDEYELTDTSVVYLFRKGEAFSRAKNFIFSYKKYYPKEAHKLYIIFKGFSGPKEYEVFKVKSLLKGINFSEVYYDDTGYDISVYIKITKIIETDFIIFLNSYSEIKKNNWLHMLRKAIKMDNTVLAGATASLESLKNSFIYISVITEILLRAPVFYNADFTKILFQHIDKRMIKNSASLKCYLKYFIQEIFYFSNYFKFISKFLLKINPEKFKIITTDALAKYNQQPPNTSWLIDISTFPNPHIRTNAFIVDRLWFKQNFKIIPLTKYDCFLFESGINGLSSKATNQGFKNALVTSEKIYINHSEWHQADAFRSGQQSSLLV